MTTYPRGNAFRSVLLQVIQKAADDKEIAAVETKGLEDTPRCQHIVELGKYCPHIAIFWVTRRNGEPRCLLHVLDVLRQQAVRRRKLARKGR